MDRVSGRERDLTRWSAKEPDEESATGPYDVLSKKLVTFGGVGIGITECLNETSCRRRCQIQCYTAEREIIIAEISRWRLIEVSTNQPYPEAEVCRDAIV